MSTCIFVNTVDIDEISQNFTSGQDLLCLPIVITDISELFKKKTTRHICF